MCSFTVDLLYSTAVHALTSTTQSSFPSDAVKLTVTACRLSLSFLMVLCAIPMSAAEQYLVLRSLARNGSCLSPHRGHHCLCYRYALASASTRFVLEGQLAKTLSLARQDIV